MKELYRSYFYPNGHEFRLEGIVSIFSDKTGMTMATLTTGETVVIVPGWIATKFLPVPAEAPTSTFQMDTDGDQKR